MAISKIILTCPSDAKVLRDTFLRRQFFEVKFSLATRCKKPFLDSNYGFCWRGGGRLKKSYLSIILDIFRKKHQNKMVPFFLVEPQITRGTVKTFLSTIFKLLYFRCLCDVFDFDFIIFAIKWSVFHPLNRVMFIFSIF